MPGKGKGRSKSSVNPLQGIEVEHFHLEDNNDDEFIGSLSSGPQRKRKFPNGPQQVTEENMMPFFGFDFTKALQSKKKRLETFANASLTSSDKKVKEMCQTQQAERNTLLESYSKQVNAVFTQWDEDMQKMKDGEEKVLSMMKQHHKLFQQQRLVQTQKFKTMKQLHEQFVKGLETLDKNHSQQTSNMQDELKKEMLQLKKKILMDSQQQEISTIRRSLQTMLAQVGEE